MPNLGFGMPAVKTKTELKNLLRYATIGTSRITEEFIQGASLVEGMELAAVYSRSAETGKAFAKRFGAPEVFTDIDCLAQSDIDAVYIASPNSLHFLQSRLFLKNNKNVICEKPATVTTAEMEELFALAEDRGLIYMEAMMSMHSPGKKIMEEALKKIGKITSAHFDFSQLSSRYEALKNGALPNIFNPVLAGGCLMDLGCYCVYPAVYFFGEPLKISASAGLLQNGADAYGAAVLDYADKQITLTYSKVGQSRACSQIMGDEGTVTVQSVSQLINIDIINNYNKSEELMGFMPKPVVMSFEAGDFFRYVTDIEPNRADYENARNTALRVNRVMCRIRELASIRF